MAKKKATATTTQREPTKAKAGTGKRTRKARPQDEPEQPAAGGEQDAAEQPPPPPAPGPANRNLGIIRISLRDLDDNPSNWRSHDELQQQALEGTIDEIGWYGYQDVFQHPTQPGRYMLVDGALRKKTLIARYGEDAEIDVNLTDFTEAEAKVALLTKDPISAMAGTDAKQLKDLLAATKPEQAAVEELLSTLAKQHKIKFDADLDVGTGDEDERDAAAAASNWDGDEDDGQDMAYARMATLVMKEADAAEYDALCQKLAERYGTVTPSDTVYVALEAEAVALSDE